jgi:hypothetical protein
LNTYCQWPAAQTVCFRITNKKKKEESLEEWIFAVSVIHLSKQVLRDAFRHQLYKQTFLPLAHLIRRTAAAPALPSGVFPLHRAA